MTPYPVLFDVERPARFDRVQVLLRVLILAVLSLVGISLGLFSTLVYLALPVIAATLVSQKGPQRFLAEDSPRLTRALGWILAVYAYFALVTDRLPVSGTERAVQLRVAPSGTPTVGGALTRILSSIPYALVLAVLGVVAWFVWLILALFVLVSEEAPAGLYDFQCGVLRWQARLLAYQASLVDVYPPFAFDAGPSALPSGRDHEALPH